jgi:hypothetical protein
MPRGINLSTLLPSVQSSASTLVGGVRKAVSGVMPGAGNLMGRGNRPASAPPRDTTPLLSQSQRRYPSHTKAPTSSPEVVRADSSVHAPLLPLSQSAKPSNTYTAPQAQRYPRHSPVAGHAMLPNAVSTGHSSVRPVQTHATTASHAQRPTGSRPQAHRPTHNTASVDPQHVAQPQPQAKTFSSRADAESTIKKWEPAFEELNAVIAQKKYGSLAETSNFGLASLKELENMRNEVAARIDHAHAFIQHSARPTPAEGRPSRVSTAATQRPSVRPPAAGLTQGLAENPSPNVADATGRRRAQGHSIENRPAAPAAGNRAQEKPGSAPNESILRGVIGEFTGKIKDLEKQKDSMFRVIHDPRSSLAQWRTAKTDVEAIKVQIKEAFASKGKAEAQLSNIYRPQADELAKSLRLLKQVEGPFLTNSDNRSVQLEAAGHNYDDSVKFSGMPPKDALRDNQAKLRDLVKSGVLNGMPEAERDELKSLYKMDVGGQLQKLNDLNRTVDRLEKEFRRNGMDLSMCSHEMRSSPEEAAARRATELAEHQEALNMGYR